MEYDVIIIGAGAVGCAVAREFSRTNLKTAVLEKAEDVACGTSGRNSAVVHAGFNNEPGSLMARLCLEGNRNFGEECRLLDVPYQKTGKILIAFDEEDMQTLRGLILQGEKNGCRGLRLLSSDELHVLAPGVGGIGAMLSPETAVTNPFLYTIALAENAAANGVRFFFHQELTGVRKEDGFFRLLTAGGSEYAARFVINSAGLSAAKVSDLFGVFGYHIYPCRGEYLILDKNTSKLCGIPVYPAPKKGIGGLGVHLTPTTDGNILLGPSSEYQDDPEDCGTRAEVLEKLFAEAQMLLPALKRSDIIGQYAGIRAKQAPQSEGGFRDFMIRKEESCPGLVNLIGIESPGLTSSVPIAKMVRKLLEDELPAEEKKDFIAVRKGPVRFRELPENEQAALIAQNPNYGEVVCRCEMVTRQEILDAIHNPLQVLSLSSVKNRTRCMTGRCQSGYCMAKVAEIITEECGISPAEILLRDKGSNAFAGYVK